MAFISNISINNVNAESSGNLTFIANICDGYRMSPFPSKCRFVRSCESKSSLIKVQDPFFLNFVLKNCICVFSFPKKMSILCTRQGSFLFQLLRNVFLPNLEILEHLQPTQQSVLCFCHSLPTFQGILLLIPHYLFLQQFSGDCSTFYPQIVWDRFDFSCQFITHL